jgi:hypothetical protein
MLCLFDYVFTVIHYFEAKMFYSPSFALLLGLVTVCLYVSSQAL